MTLGRKHLFLIHALSCLLASPVSLKSTLKKKKSSTETKINKNTKMVFPSLSQSLSLSLSVSVCFRFCVSPIYQEIPPTEKLTAFTSYRVIVPPTCTKESLLHQHCFLYLLALFQLVRLGHKL